MPLQKPYDHAIDFMEDAKLSKPAKVYPLSLAERNSLDTWIDEELRKGYICLSTSLIAAPFFFVKKHDGSLRPVDEDQREFDLETRVTTNGNLIIPEMFHSCALNK